MTAYPKIDESIGITAAPAAVVKMTEQGSLAE